MAHVNMTRHGSLPMVFALAIIWREVSGVICVVGSARRGSAPVGSESFMNVVVDSLP